ncbi:hypothetical protein [Zoogloea sp.]|uniref:hypothetical protein n=1 Tax=Zoogloea sp. TaxID=49181 RepID=UPI001415F035|nr:MAG: hypothetical protein F9K15_12825 [Zoogloea sp.]
MNLTDRQQKIILSIAAGNIRHVSEYLKSQGEIFVACSRIASRQQGTLYFEKRYFEQIDNDKYAVYYCLDREEIKSRLYDFVFVISKLRTTGLILEMPWERKDAIFPLCQLVDNKSLKIDIDILEIVLLVNDIKIFPSPDIFTFIRNGYLTQEEMLLLDDKVGRRKAEKWTRYLAVASLIVSAASILINVLTYKTFREVEITNIRDLNDTTRVEIVHLPLHGLLDTLSRTPIK